MLNSTICNKIKTIIFGSCVTRDAFEYITNEELVLVEYFARSSLASAYSAMAFKDINLETITSNFQKRIVAADLNKTFSHFLDENEFDLLIYDPIDERFNLLRSKSGELCTLSNELLQTEIKMQKKNGEIIFSGTKQFYLLWEKGWNALIAQLDTLGKRDCLRINKVFWAIHSENGQDYLPSYSLDGIKKENSFLETLYQRMAEDLHPNQFFIPKDTIIGSDTHQWGRSPFHFVESYYQELITRLGSGVQDQKIMKKPDMTLGRNCINKEYFNFDRLSESTHLDLNLISGGGKNLIKEEALISYFEGDESIYQVKIKLPLIKIANGLSVQLKLENWQSIRYLAVGYTLADNTFRNIKSSNPWLNNWIEFGFGHSDLAFKIQNGWDLLGETQIRDVRVYVKGTPSVKDCCIKIKSFCIWLEESNDFLVKIHGNELSFQQRFVNQKNCLIENFSAPNNEIINLIYEYWNQCIPEAKSIAEKFLSFGEFHIIEKKTLEWSPFNNRPLLLNSVGTYSYGWHALIPVVSFLIYTRDTKNISGLFAARDFVSQWLEHSFFSPDEDKKFTWYDHGTAERQIVLLLLWAEGLKLGFDQRFMLRLLYSIYYHAQLLNSEMFYASHQRNRYHNHAWFQDVALMCTAFILPEFLSANDWFENAYSRLMDQFNNLIKHEKNHAVFIENSIGYHLGIQRLIKFIEQLTKSKNNQYISKISHELDNFSNLMRYPDDRIPSQGDTFRKSNSLNANGVIRGTPYIKPEIIALEKAGYIIVKGNHEDSPFMLTMFSTSLSSTHKHDDNLSFTLFFDGIEWLVDPSFYSHEYHQPINSYLRSAAGHNNIAIPEMEYSIIPGKTVIRAKCKGEFFEIKGSHTAYNDFEIHRVLKGNINTLTFNIIDKITSLGTRNVKAFNSLHLGEGVSAEHVDGLLILRHPASTYQLQIKGFGSEPKFYQGFQDGNLFHGIIGHGFMQTVNAICIVSDAPIEEEIDWSLNVVSTI